MISVVTVINNYDIYNNWLKESIQKQENVEVEVVEIDNTQNQYHSLGRAYMDGVAKADGEWIMFAHPDIRFLNNTSLVDFYKRIIKHEKEDGKIGLWGAAGVEFGKISKKICVTGIVQGDNKEGLPDLFCGRECVKVQTVDPLCFVIRKQIIEKYGFTNAFDGFHLFAEELCIRLKQEGYDSAVLPVEIWHLSKGDSLNISYYKTALKIMKMYPDLKCFNTTMIQGKTGLQLKIKAIWYSIKYYLKKALNVHK